MANKQLTQAKKAKKDEFYTQLEEVTALLEAEKAEAGSTGH